MQTQEDEYMIPSKSVFRLLNEYDKHGSLTIGVDFDGTLHDYHKTGATYEQVRQLVRDLHEVNCKIIIWTAHRDHAYVAQFLKDNNIPFDGINTDGVKLDWETRKPFFNALLDDRAGLRQVYDELSIVLHTIKLRQSKDEDQGIIS